MKLPYIIKTNLKKEAVARWKKQFVDVGMNTSEGLWRRTQDEINKDQSGWKSSNDARRRMVHFFDKFNVVEENTTARFIVEKVYLWLSYALPEDEMKFLKEKIQKALKSGGWEIREVKENITFYEKDDLLFKIEIVDKYKDDIEQGRKFPENYQFVSYTLHNKELDVSMEKLNHPWSVLKTGFRKKNIRQEPIELSMQDFKKNFLPAHIEMGCGPSIEAGVEPLHYLHGIYSVTDSNHDKFILLPQDDELLTNILTDTEDFYKKAAKIHLASVEAEPTGFYELIKKMHDDKEIVGKVITNNFDGLCKVIGLKEQYIRRFSENEIIPNIDFDEKAKSLIVVGVHADRRLVQESARRAGLKVVYIDPEGFIQNNSFRSYPLEAIKKGDYIIRKTAAEFARDFKKL